MGQQSTRSSFLIIDAGGGGVPASSGHRGKLTHWTTLLAGRNKERSSVVHLQQLSLFKR